MRRSGVRWAIVASLAFATTAVACGSNTTSAASGPTNSSGPAFETIKPGILTVGSCLDYAPFETVKNGTPTGFDVEMTDAIAAKLGYDQAHVQWVKANFNTIFTAVANGQFDAVAAAVTATGSLGAKRAQTVSFSDFYYDSRQSLAVNPTQSPDITSTDQLGSGDTVGVQKGTTGEEWAVTNLQPKGVTIKSYTSATDAFRDLSGGNITGVINDEPASYGIAATMTDVKVVEPIDTHERYAFAFAPTSTALVDAWNTGLQQVIDDGEYATIYAKYFPGTPVPPAYTPGGASGSASSSPSA
jgi:polar amino acid transport system substrate-binding protein